MQVTVGVSARHVHLTQETYEKLFKTTQIEKLNDIDQPGQFASKSVVTIKNGEHKIENVRVVGPFRKYNQVELARTDCYHLKLEAPVRASGDLENTTPITIVGPYGEAVLDKGLILANRHIHIRPQDMEKYGFDENTKLCAKVEGQKAGIMKNVYLKVEETASLRLHLDTDDANAFDLKNGDEVEILRIKE